MEVRSNKTKVLSVRDGKRIAMDREAWRGIVEAVLGLNGLE